MDIVRRAAPLQGFSSEGYDRWTKSRTEDADYRIMFGDFFESPPSTRSKAVTRAVQKEIADWLDTMVKLFTVVERIQKGDIGTWRRDMPPSYVDEKPENMRKSDAARKKGQRKKP